jgi:hypothetical protein
MKEDELSYPRIATILRRLAIDRGNVIRMDIYHTGARYSVAVLLDQSVSVESIQSMNGSLMRIAEEEISGHEFDPYAVGPDYADAPMFSRYGAERIFEKQPHESEAI